MPSPTQPSPLPCPALPCPAQRSSAPAPVPVPAPVLPLPLSCPYSCPVPIPTLPLPLPLSCPAKRCICPCHCPCCALPCPALPCHAMSFPALTVPSTLFRPLIVSSALLCPCPAHHSVLCCHSPYSAVLLTVLIALRLLTLCPQFSLYFVPPCPYFASTLTFTCLSFRPALNFVHALSSFCLLIAVPPRLCCPSRQHLFTLPSAPHSSFLSHYPSYPTLAPVLPSITACPCVLFAMPFLEQPALSDALCLARHHVLTLSFPLTSPLLIHPSCADFLTAFPTLISSPTMPSNSSCPLPALTMPSDFIYSCPSFNRTLSPSRCSAPWSSTYPMFHPPSPPLSLPFTLSWPFPPRWPTFSQGHRRPGKTDPLCTALRYY